VTLTFDILTLKVVSESRVTWATFVPILVFLTSSVPFVQSCFIVHSVGKPKLFFCYNSKNSSQIFSKFGIKLNMCIKTIHFNWHVYTHYLVMLREIFYILTENLRQKKLFV